MELYRVNQSRNALVSYRLRCSVSGGLEALAEREAHSHFQDADIVWLNRGKAGSQLEINCKFFNSMACAVLASVLRFRYIEYVYLEVASVEVGGNEEDEAHLMLNIRRNAAALLPAENFNACINVWRTAQSLLSDRQDLGLESPPGELLPSLNIKESDQAKIQHERSNGDFRTFIVNTIYTKANVAEAVVCAFRRLVNLNSPEYLDDRVLWLDAGAGSGSLLQYLPKRNRIGIDIQPSLNPEIHIIDFFNVSKKWLIENSPQNPGYNPVDQDSPLCILSNPPFALHSRGDYTPIVKFINHAVQLEASYIGLIVPEKFARQRLWRSLGMSSRANLIARSLLPNDSFYDPSTHSSRHINSYFLFFGIDESPRGDLITSFARISEKPVQTEPRILVHGKRNKGDFPCISSTELRNVVVNRLYDIDTPFMASDTSSVTVSVELKKARGIPLVEVYVLLNPKQPLSLANCSSRRIPEHSLGWLSCSVAPPIAFAMLDLVMTNVHSFSSRLRGDRPSDMTYPKASPDDCGIGVNLMCGEGTIELESQGRPTSCFIISGDISEDSVKRTASRLRSHHDCLHDVNNVKGHQQTRIDFVLWDAQRLPLRSGIADFLLADLPFVGSKLKPHQEPTLSGKAIRSSLDYHRVMAQVVRVLRCKGRASLLSADTKALTHATQAFSQFWCVLWSTNINMGGLAAKLHLIEKHKQSSKDFSVWIARGGDVAAISETLKMIVIEACSGFYQDNNLELKVHRGESTVPNGSLVWDVKLMSTYNNNERCIVSHCYRVWFDSSVSNTQSKQLEKMIRNRIEHHPSLGVQLR